MNIEIPPIGPCQTVRILAINGVAISPVVLRSGDTLTISELDKVMRERNSAGEVIEPPPVIQNFVWVE